MQLTDIPTPALVLDELRMQRNIDRMQTRLTHLGVAFRPHLKTAKSMAVARRMLGPDVGPATVSTLREAEAFFLAGVRDILYAVGIAPRKLERVAALRASGCRLTVILDHVDTARAVSAFCATRGVSIPVLLEIDTDGHRSGLAPESAALLDVAAALTDGAELRGVMTHAGSSYACRSASELVACAERERAGTVRAAERLRDAGHAVPVVSVGSTPTASLAERLEGVTEVRAGVYVFQDLVMAGLGVCAIDDIAISVLATVIGHRADTGWLITDAGWMALSRDRGTASQASDQGYGVVCDVEGRVIDGLQMSGANQEHGIISRADGEPMAWAQHPVGSQLRILPNHACATAAQHGEYVVVRGSQDVTARWERFNGW